MLDLADLGIIGLCFSLILIVHLWIWRKGEVGWKLFWSVLLLFIYVGPLFYLALYNPPPKRSIKQIEADSRGLWNRF